MKTTRILLIAAAVGLTMAVHAQPPSAPPQMEKLNRGVVALPAQQKGIFVSWRLLGTDPAATSFHLLRDGKPIARNLTGATCYTDTDGMPSSHYQVVTLHGQMPVDTSSVATPWAGLFLSIPLDRPDGGTVDGREYVYLPNDCSVGDVDGDGSYEIILKWDPTNSRDNSHEGFTASVIFDCYRMDGTRLWRIDLGRNIRAGAHYTQFLVYDFNGDGRAEMMCKTAPGTTDGQGRYVSEAATDYEIRSTDNSADYRNERGRILSGPEYLTVFDGQTGRAVHTVYYNPNRAFTLGGSADYDIDGWGDRGRVVGNRGDRFLACVAHLDGAHRNASAVFTRGYYTRTCLWAVGFDGQRLTTKWVHRDEDPNVPSTYGQGSHSIAVADVDGDGCDEITFGSAAVDNDGSLLYSTSLGHGDAHHLTDLDPDRPGLEYYMVHEFPPYGADLRDARTGEILYHEPGRTDTGRGLAADIDAAHRGFEFWNSDKRAVRDIRGNIISDHNPSINFRIYWDGDLQDELLGSTRLKRFAPQLEKWNGSHAEPLPLSNGKHLWEMGASMTCNGSKATPNLQADLLGDWREELILWDSSDASHLNIFTTNIPTDHRVTTLMHDHTYRMSVCWQNVAYNQPPHLGYYLPDAVLKTKKK